jgi:NAD(P)-dependent dehydrogenase (short-subunit alcohol dehydrogenase family)
VTVEPGPAGGDAAEPAQPGHPAVLAIPVRDFAAANRIPRRVPAPFVRPPLDCAKTTGVTLDGSSRVIVALDGGPAGEALAANLRERGTSVLTLDPTASAEKLLAHLSDGPAAGPVTGIYWLRALGPEPAWDTLDLAGWRALNRQWVKELYALVRGLLKQQPEPAPFLVTATHLDGQHGYSPEGASGPLGGAVTGFAKAYQREQPGALVKALDFEPAGLPAGAAAAADSLLAETLWDRGAVEIGCRGGLRYAIGLREQPPAEAAGGLAFGRDTICLVTGAAGGITSAIVEDLASASGGVFYLLDLAPLPARDDADVALFRTDKEALKQRLIGAARSAGQRPTPAMIDKQVGAVERQEAALRAVEAVQAAGGTAYYRQVDLLNGPATAAVLDEIAQRHGRLDVIIHAAGIEISRPLADKDPAQFNLVFDVKADGLFNILSAARSLPVRAVVAFSSVAGRFGNAGQTDYSAANAIYYPHLLIERG